MTNGSTSGPVSTLRGRRDRRLGTVVSDKGDKTIRVRFDFLVKHPKYGKYLRRSTTLATHDEKNEAHKGDLVEVVACRRMSKTKCWRLTRVLERGSSIELGADGLEAASV
jgi:small subunit ribosomal protein S17